MQTHNKDGTLWQFLTLTCHMALSLLSVSYIYSLLIEKDLHEYCNVSVKFPCVYLSFHLEISSFFLFLYIEFSIEINKIVVERPKVNLSYILINVVC